MVLLTCYGYVGKLLYRVLIGEVTAHIESLCRDEVRALGINVVLSEVCQWQRYGLIG